MSNQIVSIGMLPPGDRNATAILHHPGKFHPYWLYKQSLLEYEALVSSTNA